MRFMILLKADKDTEAGLMPSEQLLADMGKFNEELIQAGVMQAGEGLHPSSKGARVRFSGGNVSVTEGPFAPSGDLLAGFWIWKLDSKEAAIEWVRKVPMPMASGEAEIEIRQIFDAEFRLRVHPRIARPGRAPARPTRVTVLASPAKRPYRCIFGFDSRPAQVDTAFWKAPA